MLLSLFKGTVSAYRVMCSLLEHSVMAVLSSLQQDDSLVSFYCLFKGTVSADRVMCRLLEHSQGWANLDQAHEDLDRNIFRDLSPTPKP